jgi:hypothetical protein
MPRPRPVAEYLLVKRLLSQGLGLHEVARRTAIPYDTVRNWSRRSAPPGPTNGTPGMPAPPPDWRPPDGPAYCYLLGLYLGDGSINVPEGASPRLILTLDAGYPTIVADASAAVSATFPGISVRQNNVPGAIVVCASTPGWLLAFPQHGPGRKHQRRIELVEWQQGLAREHPRALLRGLIHSDGSRCLNRFDVRLPSGRVGHYEYVRYFFTNYSADIRRIFCDHCDLLGIRWTQSSFKNISIAHRDSVAILDEFIGPKK